MSQSAVLIVVACIAALAPTLAVALAWWNNHQALKQIHQVVNSRLTAALDAIEVLKEEVGRLNRSVTGTPSSAVPGDVTLDHGIVRVNPMPAAVPPPPPAD